MRVGGRRTGLEPITSASSESGLMRRTMTPDATYEASRFMWMYTRSQRSFLRSCVRACVQACHVREFVRVRHAEAARRAGARAHLKRRKTRKASAQSAAESVHVTWNMSVRFCAQRYSTRTVYTTDALNMYWTGLDTGQPNW